MDRGYSFTRTHLIYVHRRPLPLLIHLFIQAQRLIWLTPSIVSALWSVQNDILGLVWPV